MKKQTKIIIAVAAAVVLIAAMVGAYFAFGPKTQEGAKTVIIEVIDKEEKTTTYEIHTDAEYLIDVMNEAKEQGFSFEGEDGQYGLTIHTVNGLKADFNVDSSYWGFYVNGEYCNYGVSEQPVADGDTFTIQYIIYK